MAPEYPKGTSQVAWYKLADLISRGEKEKVLGFYRLLSHSFTDRAYTLQVEGDILGAFNDVEAITKYRQAALLYRKDNKLVQALAVYEHLHTLEQHNHEHLAKLLEMYATLDEQDKFVDRWEKLFKLYKEKHLKAVTLEKIVKLLVQELGKNDDQQITRSWFLDVVKKSDETLAMVVAQVVEKHH